MRTQATVLLLFAFLLGGCHVSDSVRKTVTIEQSWPAAGIETIDLRGHNGSVRINVGTDDQVSLVANARTRHRDAEERISDFLKLEVDDGTLYIGERNRKRKRIVMLPFLRPEDAAISYVVTVPRRMNLAITNVNGSMKIAGVSGKCSLRSVNGSIEVSTPDAEVTAKTVNGRVRAEFLEEFHGARLGTVNGAITVSLPAGAAFKTNVSQVNGSFKSNVPMTVRGTDPIDGESGEEFEVPERKKYSLDLSTVNGSVTVNQS